MAYIICEPCVGTKDTACVDVCPVDCIHPRKDEPQFQSAEMLYIHPDECIDCGACVPACPVEAIFALDELMEDTGERLPLIVSGTVTDASGRLLSGQTVTAFWHSVRHARPLAIGLNCALGAALMRPYIAEMALQRGARDEAVRLLRLVASDCSKATEAWAYASAELRALGVKR